MYINGEWVGACDGTVFEDFCPYTGELYAEVANAGREDAKLAIKAAGEAFPFWSAVPPSEKRRLFLKAADILEKRKDEMIPMLAEEVGGAFAFGMFQANLGPDFLREAASQVHRVTGKIIPPELEDSFSMVLRQPVGVVAGISPWNAPVVLSLRAICFPIAYGNTVVLKPSAESPVSGGVFIAEIFEEAGFPKGVLNVVTNGPGRSGEIGDEFVTDRRVRRITFTGSTDVGRQLAEQCGRHLKRITLELGGNDPLIILNDADIDYAVAAAAFGRFMHQGQVCMNSKRIIVEKKVVAEFTEKFVKKASSLKVGDPLEADTVIGPLINISQLNKLKAQVEKAVGEGARLLCGGRYEGLCYYPTVLSDVTEQMQIFSEETFGPVASVITVADAEEAVRVANNSAYGLSAGIITPDFNKGLSIAERLEAGVTHINDSSLADEAHAPLGGMKDSGWGKNGMEALDEFTEIRWVTLQKKNRHFPI
jgi:aldehyde dehydrogenase (NAD+)